MDFERIKKLGNLRCSIDLASFDFIFYLQTGHLAKNFNDEYSTKRVVIEHLGTKLLINVKEECFNGVENRRRLI